MMIWISHQILILSIQKSKHSDVYVLKKYGLMRIVYSIFGPITEPEAYCKETLVFLFLAVHDAGVEDVNNVLWLVVFWILLYVVT